MATSSQPIVVRFGVFEADLRAGELRRSGALVKLQEQPFKVLAALLESPGELLTREALCLKVWGGATFVDFDHSLSIAVNKLREALGDSAENSRFIQTLPRRGYRFVAPVTEVNGHERVAPSLLPNRTPWLIVGVCALLVLCTLLGLSAWQQASSPKIRSIAVLPLEDLGGETDQDYLANGITETLITDLGRSSTLRVISSTSVRQYKGTKKALPEIARELQVDAVVEGTVLRSGDHIRVTAHLIQLPAEKQLWSQSYDRDLHDIMGLQSEMANAIISEIHARISPQAASQLAQRRAVNPEAYRLYLQGRYLASRSGVENCKKSVSYFQQAIAADPSYALAYAGLADSYGMLGNTGALPAEEGYSRMKSAALKALELDEQLGEPHESLGYYYLAYEWNWAMAEKEFRRAIELSSNFADAHEGYAEYLSHMGRMQEARAEILKAQQLDPLSPQYSHDLAWNYLYQRDYGRAVEQFLRNLDLEPGLVGSHRGLGYAYLQQGRFDKAIQEFKAVQSLQEEGNPDALALLAYAYSMAGDRVQALRIEKQLQSAPLPARPSFQLLLYLGSGEMDRAFALLDNAASQHNLIWSFVAADPRNDPLRSDPRFVELFRRINLPYEAVSSVAMVQ